jgi:hypothetical protein
MKSMVQVTGKIREIAGLRPANLPLTTLLAEGEPVVLRGVASDWEIVKRGLASSEEARRYIASFYNGRPIDFCSGDPDINSRPHYKPDFSGFNYAVRRDRLDTMLEEIGSHVGDERPPLYYASSLLVDSFLPGFGKDNDLGLAAHGIDAPPGIWIGNRTITSAHYDALNNIACVAVGRRRFTLFPPEQIFNLYPGPLDPTPGGQAITSVDFSNPDFERFPAFREALAAGRSAELEPGDAIFVPSMWWHHVEGLSPFNTLVNYWWSSAPAFMPTPMHALYHALWTIRDLPEREKQAWLNVFQYYVFGPADRAGAHLPEPARGALGPIDDLRARRIRAMLLNLLNR